MTTATATAFAVFNMALDRAVAIFATEDAASRYAEGFPQCLVQPWTIPADLFTPDGADDTPAEVVAAINATLARRF